MAIEKVIEAGSVSEAVKVVEALMPKTKPPLTLTGKDGNAFAILGAARKAARRDGWSKDQIDNYTSKATAGTYEELIMVTMQMFEVE
jgi:hypothetical protein